MISRVLSFGMNEKHVELSEKYDDIKDFLQLSCFYLPDNAFYLCILAFWVIVFLQAGLESPSEDLVESGTHGSEESFHNLVGFLVAFAVDEFDEQLAL